MVSRFVIPVSGIGICSELTDGINIKDSEAREKDLEAKEKGVPDGVNTDGQPKAVTVLQPPEERDTYADTVRTGSATNRQSSPNVSFLV
jgi:hypothetical protein